MIDQPDATAEPSEAFGELSDADPVERAVFIALDEAAAKLDAQASFEPSLTIVQGEELNIEELEGDDERCIVAKARQTVFQMSRVADAYILAYDGFVDLEDGSSDAIIVEFARPTEAQATVLGWLYEEHNGHMHYSDELYSLGSAPSLFHPGDEDGGDDDPDDDAGEDDYLLSLAIEVDELDDDD